MNASNLNFKVESGVLFQQVGCEAVLLKLSNGAYYGLDEMGIELWKSIEMGLDVDAISKNIFQLYDVEFERARKDVVLFLEALVRENLAHVVD